MPCKPDETVRQHFAHGGSIDDFDPGEDLTTPEWLLHVSPSGFRLRAEELAGMAAQSAVRFFREPENLAGLSGAVLLPLLVFRGKRVPFLPFFLVSLMGEQAGVMAYKSYRNLEVIAQASAGQIPDVSATPDDA
jgi:hypothetical protein